MMVDPVLSNLLKKPSVSYGSKNLYVAQGIFEEDTRPNLQKTVGELVPDEKPILTVNDKSLTAPMRVMLRFTDKMVI
jgi:hypothetical protein